VVPRPRMLVERVQFALWEQYYLFIFIISFVALCLVSCEISQMSVCIGFAYLFVCCAWVQVFRVLLPEIMYWSLD